MNGWIMAGILLLTSIIAIGVDRWLYMEEKPKLLWRVIPILLYLGAAIYLYLRFGFNAFWIRNLWILTLFLVSTAEDIRKKEVPLDFYPVFLLPALILHLAQMDWLNLVIAIAAYAVFYLVARYSAESIGYGDVTAIALLCLLGGYQTAGLVVLMALIVAGVLGLVLLVIRRANRKTEVPFIPFLAIAYLIYLWI